MMVLIDDLVFGKSSYKTFVNFGKRNKDGLLEDFDFGNVKHKNIQDEYTISPENTRMLNKNTAFENVFCDVFHTVCPLDNTYGEYTDIILDKFGKIRLTEPLDINGKIPNSKYYIYNQVNGDDLFKLKSIGFTDYEIRLANLK
jgi:hypothetical protein